MYENSSLTLYFAMHAVWLEEIRKGNTFFILVERTLLIIFISVLSCDIGLQFLMNLLSLASFQHFNHNLFLRSIPDLEILYE